MVNLLSRGAGRSQRFISPLALLRRRHFSPYKTYIRRDLGLVVYFNPKVGSTTIKRLLVEGLQTLGAGPMLSRLWPINHTRRYLTASLSDHWHLLRHPEHYRFITFVRNPYARLISAWKDKLAADGESPTARSVRKATAEVRRFAARHRLPGGGRGSAIPFTTFVAYVESQAEGRRDQHWDTQRSVLLTDLIPFSRVFRMETEFAVGVTEILTRLGLSPAWAAERLKRPQNASRKPSQPVFDEELADRVYRCFEADFEQFGYDRESWRGL
jgi:hypothetical protein